MLVPLEHKSLVWKESGKCLVLGIGPRALRIVLKKSYKVSAACDASAADAGASAKTEIVDFYIKRILKWGLWFCRTSVDNL